ncbi:MAG TPA: hypothetical protein ENN21_08235 [Spirochaetes bacterium]|nr:hypothetical protein [Spirochaetota bacterium]
MEQASAAKEKILVFEPHPDDVAFQLSGSVARWLSLGIEVMVCTITTGNNSNFDINISSGEIERVMAEEHRRAMGLLGLDDGHALMWRYNDLGLDPGRDRLPLLKDMVRLIRKYRPVTVVTMDPKNRDNEENADHRLAAMTGFEAAAVAAYPNVFREQFDEEGVTPHFSARVLHYMSPEPDYFVDIAGEFIGKKIELGLIYGSQLELMLTEARERLAVMGLRSDLFELPPEVIWPEMCREIAAESVALHNRRYPDRPPMEHAEAFRLQYLGVVDKLRGLIPGLE